MHSFGAVAHAGDAEFLKSLDGNWSGTGMVKVRANSSPMNVSSKGTAGPTFGLRYGYPRAPLAELLAMSKGYFAVAATVAESPPHRDALILAGVAATP